MAKVAIIFSTLYFLAVNGAVVRYEDEVLTRVPRCDTCQQTQGPPPPHAPRYYQAHHWSGFARDANTEGVFTGAAAAAQGGEQAGQAFSLAASEAESGSGYGGQAQIGAGTAASQKLGVQSGSKNYKEHDLHSPQNFDDNPQQVQSNGFNSASQGQSQSSDNSGTGYGHGQFGKYNSDGRGGASGHLDSQQQVKDSDNFGHHEQQSQSQGGYESGAQAGAATGNAGGNGAVGTGIEYGLSNNNQKQVQSNGFNSASQGQSQSSANSGAGYGHGQFGKYSSGGRGRASDHLDSQQQVKDSENFGRHEQQSQSQGGYESGAQAGAASGNPGGNEAVGTGIEYGLSNDNQQQVQSNGFNSASQRHGQGNGGSRVGYGHGHFGGYGGESVQSETQKQQKIGEAFGNEQQSQSHGSYGTGAQAGANAGTGGRGDVGTGLEYGASENNQQQVSQSNGFNSASQRKDEGGANSGIGYGGGHFGKYSSGSHPVEIGQSQQQDKFGRGFGRHEQTGQSQGGYGSGGQAGSGAGSTGSGGVGAGLEYRGQESAQTALGGALNLASQGLQVTQPPGCSTCGRSSYALSNAKSYSGSAVALSIGG